MPKISASARRALVEQRKTQILTAAAKVFAAKGFERATIADIAREAGVAEGSIYNYFKNKGDLLVSIPRQLLEPTIQTISARMPTASMSPEQTLTLMAENMVATIRRNAFIFRILISALPSLNIAAREKYMQSVIMYAVSILEEYFREQIKQGAFRSDLNPAIAARGFIGLFFPFLMLREVLQVENSADWEYDQLVPTLVPLFVRGAFANPRERKSR